MRRVNRQHPFLTFLPFYCHSLFHMYNYDYKGFSHRRVQYLHLLMWHMDCLVHLSLEWTPEHVLNDCFPFRTNIWGMFSNMNEELSLNSHVTWKVYALLTTTQIMQTRRYSSLMPTARLPTVVLHNEYVWTCLGIPVQWSPSWTSLNLSGGGGGPCTVKSKLNKF